MDILVRMPAKFGDTILGMSFIQALNNEYPTGHIDIIVQEEFGDLAFFMPVVRIVYHFSKKKHKGLLGKYHFARNIRSNHQYDLFFCLPYSFSAALLGYFAGCRQRVGLSVENRGYLFTHAFKKPPGTHFAEEFVYLLARYCKKNITANPYRFHGNLAQFDDMPVGKSIVLNLYSGDQSRTFPPGKSISLIGSIRSYFKCNVILVGGSADVKHSEEVLAQLKDKSEIYNFTGKTSLIQLASIIKHSLGVISTDSGCAHLANLLNKPLVVLFGAADPDHTKPFNPENRVILRLTELECLPCMTGNCKFGEPLCLKNIDNTEILNSLDTLINKQSEIES